MLCPVLGSEQTKPCPRGDLVLGKEAVAAGGEVSAAGTKVPTEVRNASSCSLGESATGHGDSVCKGPGVGASLAHLWNSRDWRRGGKTREERRPADGGPASTPRTGAAAGRQHGGLSFEGDRDAAPRHSSASPRGPLPPPMDTASQGANGTWRRQRPTPCAAPAPAPALVPGTRTGQAPSPPHFLLEC